MDRRGTKRQRQQIYCLVLQRDKIRIWSQNIWFELFFFVHSRLYWHTRHINTLEWWLLCLVNPRERIDMVRAMIFLDIKSIEDDKLLHRARVKLRRFQKNKSVWFFLKILMKRDEDGQRRLQKRKFEHRSMPKLVTTIPRSTMCAWLLRARFLCHTIFISNNWFYPYSKRSELIKEPIICGKLSTRWYLL